jgi:hypothetical protein
MRGAFGIPLSPARSTTRRQREYLIYTAIMVVIAALSVITNLGAAFAGSVPAVGRVAVGLLGLVAAVFLWTKPQMGWMLAMTWAVVQIPYIAWTLDGSPTAQVLDMFLGFSAGTAYNGMITDYSAMGINVVGVVLAIYLRNRRQPYECCNRWTRTASPVGVPHTPPAPALRGQRDRVVLVHVEVASGDAPLDQWREFRERDTGLRGERVQFLGGNGLAIVQFHEDADRAREIDRWRVGLRCGGGSRR